MTNPTDARARLAAYVSHESDADQVEFLARVDAVVAAETERLQGRVAELEAFAYGCDGEGCVLPHSSWCEAAKQAAAENDGCTCPQPRKGTSQPHAGYCWLVSPPVPEVDEMRKQVAELGAQRAAVLALHPKHTDSEHCQHDGEPWPCPTVQAAGASTPATIESKSSLSPTSAAIVAAGPLCTCRKFPAAHRADLHDEDGLVRDIEPVPSVGWPAMKHAKCTRCGWTSASSWLEFDRWVAQSAIADQHRDRWTDECLPEATS